MMRIREFRYIIGLKRKKQDLVIDGRVSFFVDEKDEEYTVVSMSPPMLRYKVKSEGEVDRVIDYWWSLFQNRLRKFMGSKTVISYANFMEVPRFENHEQSQTGEGTSGDTG